MKLGTLRFSPKHRAARAARGRRAQRIADAQVRPARIATLTPAEIEAITFCPIHIENLDVAPGPHRWWMAAEPGTFGVMHDAEPPQRHRSWWERLTGA